MIGMMLLHVAAGGPVTPAEFWHHWGGDPGALLSIALIAVMYGAGVHRLWRTSGRDHVVSRAEVATFYCGILTLLIALCSPLDAIADTLFSGHMLQHVLLIAVAAPLMVLGAPLLPLLWSLPRATRVGVGRTWNAIGMRSAGARLARPLPAWGLHTVALWGWHLPGPYSAALASAPIHALEHICFYLTALLMWWVALRPLRGHGGYAGAVFVLAGTFAQSGVLGAILTFSGTPWYYAQSAGAGAWHLTALEDQQLAGLIMWIPAGFFYLIGILAVVLRVFDTPVGPIPAAADLTAADDQARAVAAYPYTLH
jgi:putative membrane protein